MIPNINLNIQNKNSLTISCIRSRIELVEKHLVNLLISFGNEWKKKKYKLIKRKQIEIVFNEPENKSIKFLIWTPQVNGNKFTIFINNFTDGWITLLNEYSIKYNKIVTMATLSDQSTIYPIFRFYHRDKFNVRRVQVLKEVKKWEFYQDGQPLRIEDSGNYNKRKLSERLNDNIVENYMKKLGFDYTKKEFWLSEGDAIEYTFVLG